MHTCYAEASALLQEHRDLLDEVSEYLLAKETITGEELMAFVNKENKPEVPADPAETAEEE